MKPLQMGKKPGVEGRGEKRAEGQDKRIKIYYVHVSTPHRNVTIKYCKHVLTQTKKKKKKWSQF